MTTLVTGVPDTRKINGFALNTDINLTLDILKAAPSGYGLGEAQAYTVSDANSD